MTTPSTCRHPESHHLRLLALAPLLLAAGLWCLSGPARAETFASCELLKQQLASRIPPEIRGYSMDDVPAKTPLPAGGKVIGNCEGGARKIVYRRFGGAPLVAGGPVASAPSGAPTAAPTATPTATPAIAAAAKPSPSAPAPKPAAPPPARVASAAVEPARKPEPPVAAAQRTVPASAPLPVAKSSVPTASAPSRFAATPASTPVTAMASAPASAPSPLTSADSLLSAAKSASLPTEPARPMVAAAFSAPPTSAGPPPIDTMPPAADGDGFFARYGHWLWGLLALPVAALLWAWVSHRMAYDSAGLPRGPRL